MSPGWNAAAFHERNPHRLGVADRHGLVEVHVLGRALARRAVVRNVLEVRVVRVDVAQRRQAGHDGRPICTPGTAPTRPISRCREVHALGRVVAGPRQHEAERRELRARSKPDIHAGEVEEAADEQAGADHQQHGERDLTDHQRRAQPRAHGAGAAARRRSSSSTIRCGRTRDGAAARGRRSTPVTTASHRSVKPSTDQSSVISGRSRQGIGIDGQEQRPDAAPRHAQADGTPPRWPGPGPP